MEPEKNTCLTTIKKSPTGIAGFDEITGGGLPMGRPTLVCGGPGCGKTVLAMEFLTCGVSQFNEPGLFVSFEESNEALISNFNSFGLDLQNMIENNQFLILQAKLRRDEIFEAGEFTLDGLLIRLENAIKKIGARRVVLDTLESLFSHLTNTIVLRAEIARLFEWLKDKNVTCVITGERGEKALTRHGFEEYVSDCVIFLDHRISNQISKRRLRIVKYRGSTHGLDEYPYIIGDKGISILPITELHVAHEAQLEQMSTGLDDLDAMLSGKGYYCGSSILVSGSSGTGKSTLAASFANAVCKSGKKCLYMAFEESESQIVRNMRSVGVDLSPYTQKGSLILKALFPTMCGLEEHLVRIHKLVDDCMPDAVIIDPISNFVSVGENSEIKAMFSRILHYLRTKNITTLLTNLTGNRDKYEETDMGISSMVDTWIVIYNSYMENHRLRNLYVVKSRGMKHSELTREFVISTQGLSIRDLPAPGSGEFEEEKHVRRPE